MKSCLRGGNNVRAYRSGFSLLEVIMVTLIFSLVMAGIFQGVKSARQFTSRASLQDDLVLESRRLIQYIVTDLSSSAWYIPIDADGDGTARPPTGADFNDLAALTNPALDRDLLYYPYVIVQSASGRGTAFDAYDRAPAEIVDPASLPAALPASHRALSQEVVFLKVSRSQAAATPAEIVAPTVNFNVPPVSIAASSAARTGIDNVSIYALTSGGVVSDIPLAWESHLDAPDQNDPEDLREYAYVVTPNTLTGKGQLERRYRNGGGAVTLDRILSTDVDRIVVDTYRTLASLNVNQVRIALYLSKEQIDHPGVFQTYRIEVTAALRSTVDPEYSLNLGDWLGASGAFDVN
jgi:prepilin-type N-terminal cleavage/methylation domain-containing protein